MSQDVERADELEEDLNVTNTFNIQVYNDEGRLLSEYTIDSERDQVSTLRAAEDSARKKLRQTFLEPLILIISEQTLTKLRQVQVTIATMGSPS